MTCRNRAVYGLDPVESIDAKGYDRNHWPGATGNNLDALNIAKIDQCGFSSPPCWP